MSELSEMDQSLMIIARAVERIADALESRCEESVAINAVRRFAKAVGMGDLTDETIERLSK